MTTYLLLAYVLELLFWSKVWSENSKGNGGNQVFFCLFLITAIRRLCVSIHQKKSLTAFGRKVDKILIISDFQMDSKILRQRHFGHQPEEDRLLIWMNFAENCAPVFAIHQIKKYKNSFTKPVLYVYTNTGTTMNYGFL